MTTVLDAPAQPAKSFFVENIVEPIGRQLDANPLIHKIVVFAAHLIRLIGSLALITFLPFSMPVNCVLSLASNIFYRITIERNCSFLFAINDCLGAMALHFTIPYLVNQLALSSFAMLAATLASTVPFLAYLGYTVWVTHSEVEERSRLLNSQKPKSCCM